MENGKSPLVLGLGNDIAEIERIRESISTYGQHFLSRIFTLKEQDYCSKYKDPVPHFAARFSAKEAIAKALGTGIGAHVAWKDLEILNDASGKPIVHFSETLRERTLGTEMLLSISHSEHYVTTVALWLRSG